MSKNRCLFVSRRRRRVEQVLREQQSKVDNCPGRETRSVLLRRRADGELSNGDKDIVRER